LAGTVETNPPVLTAAAVIALIVIANFVVTGSVTAIGDWVVGDSDAWLVVALVLVLGA
jgi:hypothetical protein